MRQIAKQGVCKVGRRGGGRVGRAEGYLESRWAAAVIIQALLKNTADSKVGTRARLCQGGGRPESAVVAIDCLTGSACAWP
jgi:hypothetical protein